MKKMPTLFERQFENHEIIKCLEQVHEGQGNPYNLDTDILEKHGTRILNNVPRTYEGLKEYLNNHYIEGIVFYRDNGEMCKIKRTDFSFKWKLERK